MSSSIRIDWRPFLAVWLVAIVFFASKWASVWAGDLPDSDDLMRLQQVRDLLSGQGWWDVHQARLVTPEGGAMHWSRIPDIFIGGIIMVLRPFAGPAIAENVALIIWPTLLLGAVMALLSLLMHRLNLSKAASTIGLVAFFLAPITYQYWPGRIDHHSLIAVFVLLTLVSLLSPARSKWWALGASMAILAMLSTAIESLPFAAMLISIMAVLWIVRGAVEGQRLMIIGAVLALCSGLFYMLDAPGQSSGRNECDAFGNAHLLALVIGGGLLSLLGSQSARLSTYTHRSIATGLAGGVVLVCVMVFAPNCLGDPYASMPADIQIEWLNQIQEARSIFQVIAHSPNIAIANFGFIVAGLVATGIAARRHSGITRLYWMFILGMLVGASLLTAWQVRSVLFAHLLAIPGVGYVVGALFTRYREAGGVPALMTFATGFLLLSPLAWTLSGGLVTPKTTPIEAESVTQAQCQKAGDFAQLKVLPVGNVFTHIDLGAQIISTTPHSVYAAPYHRNASAISRVIDIFRSPPNIAENKLRERGTNYVVWCEGATETRLYASETDSFAKALSVGEVPDWLVPISADSAIPGLAIYSLREKSGSR